MNYGNLRKGITAKRVLRGALIITKLGVIYFQPVIAILIMALADPIRL